MSAAHPRVTIATIARQVGVTHGTVSRALREDPRVAAATARRIRAAAKRLGYVPNRLGQGLRTQRSHTLGVVMPEISSPFFSEVLRAIHDTVAKAGYTLLVTYDRGCPATAVRTLWERRVDGLFVACLTDWAPGSGAIPVPYLVLNHHAPERDPCSLSTDDAAATRALVEHLLGLGHRHLAYLGNACAPAIDVVRAASFRAVLAEAGVPAADQEFPLAAGGDPEAGYRAVRAWSPDRRATALVCFNDLMAVGALRALGEAGVDVPGQVSVVGFDDIDLAAYTSPPLTTFAQPRRALGQAAAEQLLRVLDGEPAQALPRLLRGHLVVRASTASPGGGPP